MPRAALALLCACTSQAWLRPTPTMRRPLARTIDVARRAQPNADADASAPISDGRRTALLASLVAVYTSNQWCRSLLFSTVDFGSDDGVRFVNAALGPSRSSAASSTSPTSGTAESAGATSRTRSSQAPSSAGPPPPPRRWRW